MTTKLEQAARQALEALEVYEIKLNSRLCNETIIALREALAEQVKHEPVCECRRKTDAVISAEKEL